MAWAGVVQGDLKAAKQQTSNCNTVQTEDGLPIITLPDLQNCIRKLWKNFCRGNIFEMSDLTYMAGEHSGLPDQEEGQAVAYSTFHPLHKEYLTPTLPSQLCR